MGMITVRAPSGELISVRIAGDEPTEEEMNAISSSLSEQQTTSDTEPQPTKEPVAEQDTDYETVAALAATGVGIPWAMAIVGGASALGYVADEAFEYAQGVRDETLEGDAKNVAFELLAGGLGEGGGRLIARGLGRLFKGPGNAEANAAREVAREILGGQVDPVTGKLVRGAPTVRSINMIS